MTMKHQATHVLRPLASDPRAPRAGLAGIPSTRVSATRFTIHAVALASVLALSVWPTAGARAQTTILSGGGNGSRADFAEGQGGAAGLAGGGGGGGGGYSTDPDSGLGGNGGAGAQVGTPAQAGTAGAGNGLSNGASGGAAGGPDLSAGGGGGGGGAYMTSDGVSGGAGGAGTVNASASVTLASDVTGTAGANPGPRLGYSGGGGGGGGGLVLTAPGAAIDIAGRTVTGGAGGSTPFDGGGGGGAGLALVDGGSIVNAAGRIVGGAGGDGYNGGEGGTSVFLFRGGKLNNGAGAVLTGGVGGTGSSTFDGLEIARGGDGGDAVRSNGGQITNAGTAQGGAGGVATAAGNGGDGIVASGAATVTNTATGQILGGAGGAVGGTEPASAAGRGGSGVVLLDAGATVVNDGTVSGGNAGAAGVGTGAAGAVGIVGSAAGGNTVVNGGRISGGFDSAGTVRANAVELQGSGNRLELRAGAVFDGDAVVAPGGSNNTLALGGDATASGFDVGTIGTAYQGFDGFHKSGTSVWTLTGTQAGVTPWTVDGGVLALTDSANLGAAAGTLTVNDGTLRLAADGLQIANAVTLGTGQPTIDTGAFTGTLAGAVGGSGSLTKVGTGTLVLGAANTYGGATTVSQGTLRAGAANTLSAASAHTVAAGATLDVGGFNQTVASLSNAGTVSLLSGAPGTTLTVTGAYVGNGGVLRLGTALGGNGSATDRLLLDGGSASGNTTVQITNLGGLGAQTTANGIEVVAARNGATSTANAFALANGHVDAGAYAYTLHGADQSWYLRSETDAVTPVTPGNPGTPVTPGAPVTPPATVPTYRTEVPLFAALPQQLRQADLAMLGNLHQRIGDEPVAGAPAANGPRNAWGRVISSDIDVRQQGTVSPASKGRVDGFQVGTDLFADAHWHAGIYVGQLDGDVRTSGFANGVWGGVGSNDLRARYLGLYATWTNGSGFYADAVLQAGDHRYTLRPQGNPSVTGKGDSLLASIELGQSFALGQGWTIEPQLQLIHQRVDLDDVVISGARVQQDADSGWIARAGVRVKGETSTALGALQPYGRVNLYRASSGTDIARFIGPAATTDIATRTGGSWGEVAGGATLALNTTWSVYGEIGRLFALGGDARVKSGVQGSVGLKARW